MGRGDRYAGYGKQWYAVCSRARMLDKRWRRPKKTVCAASSVSEYAAILFYAGVISEHFMPSSIRFVMVLWMSRCSGDIFD